MAGFEEFSYEYIEHLSRWKLEKLQHEIERQKENKIYCERILRCWAAQKSFEDEDFWKKRNIDLLMDAVVKRSWYVVSCLLHFFRFDNDIIAGNFDMVRIKDNWLLQIASHIRESNKSQNLADMLFDAARDLEMYLDAYYYFRVNSIDTFECILTRLEANSSIPDNLQKQMKEEILGFALKFAIYRLWNSLPHLLKYLNDEFIASYFQSMFYFHQFNFLFRITSEYYEKDSSETVAQIIERERKIRKIKRISSERLYHQVTSSCCICI